jgi:hypothetical protein
MLYATENRQQCEIDTHIDSTEAFFGTLHALYWHCLLALLQCRQNVTLPRVIFQILNWGNERVVLILLILYAEFLALLAKHLCQRLTILQESCKMAKFLKYNKLTTSVVKIRLNTSIARRCQTFVRLQ